MTRVQADFDNLPPKEFLIQIADTAMKGYLFLWDQKDKDFHVKMRWDEIGLVFHRNTLNTILRRLASAGLLYFHRSDENGIDVELVGWDEIDD